MADALELCGCGGNPVDNPISATSYHDWMHDPHQVYCFHCAAQCELFQHRASVEFPGADPRYWHAGDTPGAILEAYHAANFSLMVARSRCDNPSQPPSDFSENEAATAARLDAASYFLESGDIATARFIILPIGQPAYFNFGIEPRPFAFGKDNRERLRDAWQRIADHCAAQLQSLLAEIPNPAATFCPEPDCGNQLFDGHCPSHD